MCAERIAIMNAKKSCVDLMKCTLYTNGDLCCECTKVILQAGIMVVVCKKYKEDKAAVIEEMVYRAKACFK